MQRADGLGEQAEDLEAARLPDGPRDGDAADAGGEAGGVGDVAGVADAEAVHDLQEGEQVGVVAAGGNEAAGAEQAGAGDRAAGDGAVGYEANAGMAAFPEPEEEEDRSAGDALAKERCVVPAVCVMAL